MITSFDLSQDSESSTSHSRIAAKVLRYAQTLSWTDAHIWSTGKTSPHSR